MMGEFKLGDRVVMIGTAEKERVTIPGAQFMFDTHFVEKPLPHVYNSDGGTTYSEGIIIGRRFPQEGKTHCGYEGERIFRTNGKTCRVWLVAFDLRYKPVMCFDHQITLKEEK